MPPTSGLLQVQLLTSPRPGAIAVVRLVGPEAWERVQKFATPLRRQLPAVPEADRLYMAPWTDADGEVDEVILACLLEHGIQVVDICCHGSPIIAQRIIRSLMGLGAQLITGGGTSLLGESASLIEQECDHLLIRAPTRRAALFLARQRTALPSAVRRLAEFAEDRRDEVELELRRLLDQSIFGIRLAQGARVALVGDVNAGKSTLCNALSGRQVALSSEQAGTTRDWVSTDMAIDGCPITLLDTPGLRTTPDPLEVHAIERASSVVAGADLRLLVIDASATASKLSMGLEDLWQSPGQTLVVANKLDLVLADEQDHDATEIASEKILNLKSQIGISPDQPIKVSALTGQGLDSLRWAILDHLGLREHHDHHPCPFTPRQADALRRYLDLSDDPRPSLKAWVDSEFDPH